MDPNDDQVVEETERSTSPTSHSMASVHANEAARASPFRKFRSLLIAKRYEGHDDLPIQVIPGLYIGSFGAANHLQGLQDAGITHILCVTPTLPFVFPEQFQYRRVSVGDTPDVAIDTFFPSSIAFIDSALAAGGRVLVHCQVGRSRSATIVLAYLIQRHHQSFQDALALVRAVRPQIQPNQGFLRQLRRWAAQLTSTASD
ncbi:hypothetical protein Poli38472_010750 [Pythium oligandrum]|uniref:protein-tyrosine-phosphatase n=1 Tax=Pythium oligandrum TaxID=41045 RepID=A0A8K1CE87_PYTOL|nr:hypothetical protein Poli38472_010750 [Pythium oligandrum]|eukprot:TMW61687.1 hypothetical protein Poli38472_010750 [Pythium oligandrum]